MKEFNYQDYLEYKKLEIIETKGMMKLEEKGEKYHIYQPHDKIFKTVLNQKSQVAEFINRILELKEKITEKEIEKYDSEYIGNMFEKRQTDIVYKMKEKEIYFLIEHQSQIDYNMPQRILEYEVVLR